MYSAGTRAAAAALPTQTLTWSAMKDCGSLKAAYQVTPQLAVFGVPGEPAPPAGDAKPNASSNEPASPIYFKSRCVGLAA